MKRGLFLFLVFLLLPAIYGIFEQPNYYIPITVGGQPTGIFSLSYDCAGKMCAQGKPINWSLTVKNQGDDELWLWGVQLFDNQRKTIVSTYRQSYSFYISVNDNKTFYLNSTLPKPVVNGQMNVSPCIISKPETSAYSVVGSEIVHCFTENYLLPINDCWIDEDCALDKACADASCTPLACEYCQFADNHVCIDYQCCQNTECAPDQSCKEHQCQDILCDENQDIFNHTCSNNICLENEAIVDYSCVALRCKDDEVPLNHQCAKLVCQEWEEPKNQRCEELKCLDSDIYQDHKCVTAKCEKNEGVINHACVALQCPWYQAIENHQCVIHRSMFRDMLFIIIVGGLIAALTYSFYFRIKKREFQMLWQQAMRRKKIKEGQNKPEQKK